MAKSKVTFRVSHRAKEIEELKGKKVGVEVGVFDEGLAQIGSYHEFGTNTIPKRSFIRAWMAMNNRKVQDMVRESFTEAWEGKSTKSSVQKAGEFAVEGIKARILSKIPPKLAASTIRQKSGPNKLIPLIDRGDLFRSIDWRPVEE